MKAKTLMGMIACAGACVSLSAFGNNTNAWFNAGVDGVNITLSGVSTNGVAVQVSEGKIVLDNEKESALTFTPVVTNMSTGVSVIKATAELTPSDATSLDTTLPEAKVGFAVGIAGNATNYYGFASGVWFKLDGVNPPDSGDTEFQLILDYRSASAQFFVKNSGSYQILSTNGTTTTFTFDKGSASDISGIDAYGSGSISSLAGDFELAVCAIENGNRYGSLADAIAAGGSSNNILDVDANGATGSSTTAANGLSVAVCKALGISTTEANTPAVAIEPVASDSDASNINFKLADSVSVETGVAVTFAVKKDGTPVTGSPFASGAIKIPLASGTGVYTIEPAGVAAE